ncbi:MAG: TIGR00282 family metallophosphoesterase [Pseudomonadota bacterium]
MRILILGDIVGRSGRRAVVDHIQTLKERLSPEFIVINGENAAGGFGITEAIYSEIMDLGIDAITLGNHAFDQREALVFITRVDRLIRPINFPDGTPGPGAALVPTQDGRQVLVINALGRVFIDGFDDPFRMVEREVDACPLGEMADAVILDFHAEATSEKQALAAFLDGRVSALVGTHTHAPTSDHRVMPGGTAFVSDLGMCGDYDSVLGMEKAEPVHRFLHKIPSSRFEPSKGDGTVSGVFVETDDKTGLAKRIAPVRIGGALEQTIPEV